MTTIRDALLDTLARMEAHCLDTGDERALVADALLEVAEIANAPISAAKLVYAVGLVEKDDRYLVRVRTNSPKELPDLDGAYECPGGKVHTGETIVGGLKREFHEETGLTVTKVQLIDIYDDPRTDVPQTATTFFFRVTEWEGRFKDEFQKEPWEWRTEEEICRLKPQTPTPLLSYFRQNSDLIPLFSATPLELDTYASFAQNDLFKHFKWIVYRTDRKNIQVQIEPYEDEFSNLFFPGTNDVWTEPHYFNTRDEALRSAGWVPEAKIRRYTTWREFLLFMEDLRDRPFKATHDNE